MMGQQRHVKEGQNEGPGTANRFKELFMMFIQKRWLVAQNSTTELEIRECAFVM